MEGSAMACSPAMFKGRERPVGSIIGRYSHEPGAQQFSCGTPSLVWVVDAQRLKVSIVRVLGGAVTVRSDRFVC